ncbi:DHA1 family purine base/nucleoside efflux pump-like MFS transporter [Actinopolyspora biskrensis]|uniref:DHA1 family purine base/nucleoside efflux pump-like MFS transporter n=1 Tax=Actinopolyspora biskrensis TaxID=1470178 RepID=A0A852Z4H1_9ACTN|nr:MFS transporter [Actinopolyspora biskrensis]NYH80629.1 DHA1 family purine base/nucleoside efflux pump-like MFS transporter [Actinopolyspora biskrensis]
MSFRLLVLAVGTFVVNTGSYLVAGVLPAIAGHIGVSVTVAGQLVTVHALTYAVSAPVLSTMVSRWERRRLLWFSLGLFATSNVATALAPDFATLTAARVLGAIGASLFTPTAVVIASDLVPLDRRGRAVSVVLSGLTLATVIGVPTGVLLNGVLGYQGLFWLVAVLGVVAALALRALPAVPAPPPVRLGERVGVLRNRAVALVLTVSALASLADFAGYTYAAPMLESLTGASAGALGVLLFVYGAAGATGNVVVGRVTDRFGSGVGIVGSLLVLTAGLALLPLAGTALPVSAALLALWGFGGWGIMPAVQHRLIALKPAMASVVIAFNSSAMYLGMGLGGVTGGAVVSRWGWDALGPASAAVAVVALLLLRWPRSGPQRHGTVGDPTGIAPASPRVDEGSRDFPDGTVLPGAARRS